MSIMTIHNVSTYNISITLQFKFHLNCNYYSFDLLASFGQYPSDEE